LAKAAGVLAAAEFSIDVSDGEQTVTAKTSNVQFDMTTFLAQHRLDRIAPQLRDEADGHDA
jgi:hypothetical protein